LSKIRIAFTEGSFTSLVSLDELLVVFETFPVLFFFLAFDDFDAVLNPALELTLALPLLLIPSLTLGLLFEVVLLVEATFLISSTQMSFSMSCNRFGSLTVFKGFADGTFSAFVKDSGETWLSDGASTFSTVSPPAVWVAASPSDSTGSALLAEGRPVGELELASWDHPSGASLVGRLA